MRHLFFLLTTDERCARDSARSSTRVCVRACVRVRAGQQSEESDSVSRVCVWVRGLYTCSRDTVCANVRARVHACDGHGTGARVSFIFCYFSLCILTIRTPSRD